MEVCKKLILFLFTLWYLLLIFPSHSVIWDSSMHSYACTLGHVHPCRHTHKCIHTNTHTHTATHTQKCILTNTPNQKLCCEECNPSNLIWCAVKCTFCPDFPPILRGKWMWLGKDAGTQAELVTIPYLWRHREQPGGDRHSEKETLWCHSLPHLQKPAPSHRGRSELHTDLSSCKLLSGLCAG